MTPDRCIDCKEMDGRTRVGGLRCNDCNQAWLERHAAPPKRKVGKLLRFSLLYRAE